MRKDLQCLKKAVEGRTVFILGGGTSVTPQIIQLLNESNSKVFCLNSSSKFITKPIGILWCDDSWAAKNYNLIESHKCPKFYVKHNAQQYIKNDIRSICQSTVLNKTGDFGMDHNIDNVRGNNSGANAINLLVNCKAKTIGLVGFDMYTEKDKAHFHQEYTYSIRPSIYKDLFIPSIESLSKEIIDSGAMTTIFNCNRLSALKCFKYETVRNLI